MAYVSLGRSEQLKDIFIKGEIDPEGIQASPLALEETIRGLQDGLDAGCTRAKSGVASRRPRYLPSNLPGDWQHCGQAGRHALKAVLLPGPF